MKEQLQEAGVSWEKFTPSQRVAALAVTALTAARPVLAGMVSRRGLDKTRDWTLDDTTQLGMAYATDLEGQLARASGTTTRLGGTLDPLADKLATNPHEFVLAYRGEESWLRASTRLARDLGVSAIRSYAQRETHGTAKTSANKTGKLNTVLRQSADLFATSPLGKKYPKVRTGLQIASTVSTVASGAYTAYDLLRQVHTYKKHSKDQSRE